MSHRRGTGGGATDGGKSFKWRRQGDIGTKNRRRVRGAKDRLGKTEPFFEKCGADETLLAEVCVCVCVYKLR